MGEAHTCVVTLKFPGAVGAEGAGGGGGAEVSVIVITTGGGGGTMTGTSATRQEADPVESETQQWSFE